jgi:hypothetical protein
MIMTNGLGAFIGGTASGWVVDRLTANGVRDRTSIWRTFAGYALLPGIVFPLVLKYLHDPGRWARLFTGPGPRGPCGARHRHESPVSPGIRLQVRKPALPHSPPHSASLPSLGEQRERLSNCTAWSRLPTSEGKV